MPNWFHNELSVIGDAADAADLRRLMTTKRSVFDFEAIAPMPKEMRDSESSTDVDLAWTLKYGDWNECDDLFGGQYGPSKYASRQEAMQAAEREYDDRPSSCKKRGIRSLDELADIAQGLLDRHEHRDWYSWACANWGTKWTADHCAWMGPSRTIKRDAQQVATFCTANSPAVALIRTLSQRFPTLTLRLTYAEELNQWSGFVTLEAGEIVAEKHTINDQMPSFLSHNLKENERDYIYVGDARDADDRGLAFGKSKWANPFHYVLWPLSNQKADLYRRWILGDAEATKQLPEGDWNRPTVDEIRDELRGVNLLCDCDSNDTNCCHGRILYLLADGWDGEEEDYSQDEHDPPRVPGNAIDAAG
jgi:hypothetical protein